MGNPYLSFVYGFIVRLNSRRIHSMMGRGLNSTGGSYHVMRGSVVLRGVHWKWRIRTLHLERLQYSAGVE
jgi:hypothetical protein